MDKIKLLELYPGYTSVLGPYTRKDGRQHIILNNSNLKTGEKGKVRTVSYPKALKEVEVGRRLLETETVDHHDRDFTNDDSRNLIIKDLSIHAKEDALKVRISPVKCALDSCTVIFVPNRCQRNKQSSALDGYPAGPFCSKKCAGKYGAAVQNGQPKQKRSLLIKEYYRDIK